MIKTEVINGAMGARRLTNNSLAELAGVSAPTISSLRNGKWNGDIETLKSIVNALGLKIMDVIDEEAAA